jgi:hypothetical protein
MLSVIMLNVVMLSVVATYIMQPAQTLRLTAQNATAYYSSVKSFITQTQEVSIKSQNIILMILNFFRIYKVIFCNE